MLGRPAATAALVYTLLSGVFIQKTMYIRHIWVLKESKESLKVVVQQCCSHHLYGCKLESQLRSRYRFTAPTYWSSTETSRFQVPIMIIGPFDPDMPPSHIIAG